VIPAADETEPARRTLPPFLVVGVGASVGGLQAIEELLAGTSPEVQAAFVVVTHQAPGQTSLLPELLRKRTTMTVTQVEEFVALAPGCIYLPPPGAFLTLEGPALRVEEAPRGIRLPIDHFFRSLAQVMGPRAVGVVLSGTGSDGTEGLRAIKAEGGRVVAQEERTAAHSGMPRSAVATGLVDLVLAPPAMGAALRAYADRSLAVEDGRELSEPLLQRVFVLLRQRTGHDFSLYKRKTVQRRIERRILLHQLAGLREYLQLLVERPDELDDLFQELLIGVTSFFRDPEAFESLCQEALPSSSSTSPRATRSGRGSRAARRARRPTRSGSRSGSASSGSAGA